jgi:hypothetical protein
MSNIKLSPTHGVNPSIIKCFFCGGDKGIGLLGILPGDKEAPRECVIDHEPCPACIEKFKQGFLIVEAFSDRTPTGSYWLLKNEVAEQMFPEDIYKHGKALILKETAIDLGLYEVGEDNG